MFSRVQQSMGGRLRFIITGSAPISSKVMDFARVAFGCQVQYRKGREGGGGRSFENGIIQNSLHCSSLASFPGPYWTGNEAIAT